MAKNIIDEDDINYIEELSTYGRCATKNPYRFIPDIDCNTDEELLNWRHAIQAYKKGVYEAPEHYLYKVLVTDRITKADIVNMLDEADGALSAFNADGKTVIHGHYVTWGLGISALSDKVNVWDEYPVYKWLLEYAEDKILFDNEFLFEINKYKGGAEL